MGKFISDNFIRVVCKVCKSETIASAGHLFDGLKCQCEYNKSTEISIPVQEECNYINTVVAIGRFKNGDYEVCNDNNIDDNWRVPKDTFESMYIKREFERVEVNTPLTSPSFIFRKETISISEIKEYFLLASSESIEADYSNGNLIRLARMLGIKNYKLMKKETLIKRVRGAVNG